MTAIANARLTDFAGLTPARGTLPSAANQLFYRKTIVSMNASGDAVVPSDGDGFPALGAASNYYDNRTGSEAGGTAGDLDIEVEYGVFGWEYVSADGVPAPRDHVYVVDNQTVSVDSAGGTRGLAGVVSEVRDGQAFVHMGPSVGDGSGGSASFISVPIGMTPVFGDGTANGMDPTVFGYRLNNTVDDEPFIAAIAIPADRDPNADLVVTARAYIIDDATDDDVVMVLVARVDGGADVAPVSAVVLGESAADIEFAIPAADVPAGSRSLYIELDCAATLDTSDAVIESVHVRSVKTAAA